MRHECARRPLVAAVIVNFNGLEDTLACVESLRLSDYKELRIFVVDNGSVVNPKVPIEGQFPGVTVLVEKTNLGFAGGCNVGIEAALSIGVDYVLLVNNDTVIDSRAISALVGTLVDGQDIGLATGIIYLAGSTTDIWYAGGYLSVWRASCVHLKSLPAGAILGEAFDTGFVSGCMALIPSTILRLTGLLDSRMFFGVDDILLSWQVRRAGYRLVVNPHAILWHKWKGSRTQVSSQWQMTQGCLGRIVFFEHVLDAKQIPFSRSMAVLWTLVVDLGSTLAGHGRPLDRWRAFRAAVRLYSRPMQGNG